MRTVLPRLAVVFITVISVVGFVIGGGLLGLGIYAHSLQASDKLDPFMKAEIVPILDYMPNALLSYPFIPKTNKKVKAAEKKLGGFMRGICHGNTDYEKMRAAGIGWNRIDIPYPYGEDGGLSEGYINFKARSKGLTDNGIKVFAVTPKPYEFAERGIDPRLKENEEKIKAVASFLTEDLKGLVGAFQIANELGIPRFAEPLESTEQKVRFIGIQAEAIAASPYKGNILVGYNSAGPSADLHAGLRKYKNSLDYVGFDLYVGCFAGVDIMNRLELFDLIPAFLYSLTRLPVVCCEFGYMSGGAPKSAADKLAVLAEYGFSSEAEARERIDELVKQLPPRFQGDIERAARQGNDPAGYVFGVEMSSHLYRELPRGVAIKGIPHTPEGQADFYKYIIKRLLKKPYIVGAVAYCWSDSELCYVCGFNDCPVETRWGLVDREGTPKPAYYALRDAWTGKRN